VLFSPRWSGRETPNRFFDKPQLIEQYLPVTFLELTWKDTKLLATVQTFSFDLDMFFPMILVACAGTEFILPLEWVVLVGKVQFLALLV